MNRLLLGLYLAFLLPFVSCNKDLKTDDPDPDASVMVSKLNGFEYVGSFEEEGAPVYYAFPNSFYTDDYQNNDRVLIMCQSTLDNPPLRTKWYINNYHNGKMTKSFGPPDGFGPGWGNFMQFCFNHEEFSLHVWHNTERYFNKIDTASNLTGYVIANGTSENYASPLLIKDHLLRRISEVSFWPYNTLNQQDEPQYLLTGELSAMVNIDYFIDYENYDQLHGNSIYTGYFYPTLYGNWIGVSVGNTSLDTLLISNYPPNYYFMGLCRTYVEKVGDVIYLAFIKNKLNPNTDQDLSMYELKIGENILKPLFVDMDLPPDENYEIKALRNGKLIIYPTPNAIDQTPYTLSVTGAKEDFLLPELNNSSIIRQTFGKKYLYLTLNTDDNGKRLEFYKKDLFQ